MPHTPPSPSSTSPPNKRARLAEDTHMPVPPLLDGAKPQINGSAPSKSKKSGKNSARKLPPIDPVLKLDLLQVLGWTELPKPTNPPSASETLGRRIWPSVGPKDRAAAKLKQEDGAPASEAPEATGWEFSEAEFHVVGLSSHGDGLAVYPPASEGPAQWAVIIPFTLPGDIIRAKVTRHAHYHSYAEPLNLPSTSSYIPSSSTSFPLPLNRDISLAQCKYFTSCAGCQYQSLPYSTQLSLKRLVVQKAMRNFSGLTEGKDWPEVGETIPSPEQWGYRTKITPHFELPRALQTGKKGRQNMGKAAKGKGKVDVKEEEMELVEEEMTNGLEEDDVVDLPLASEPEASPEFDVPIGFNEACRSRILDIEECPIATPVINASLPVARRAVKMGIRGFKRGATLLFRDSLVVELEGPEKKVRVKGEEGGEQERVCVTKHSETITERVGKVLFQFPAGSFFQNNSSILEPLTEYVKSQVGGFAGQGQETYLVDAYCGSGLFSLCLASAFTKVLGIEIDPQSISYAKHNAKLNKISNADFYAGASEDIFDTVITGGGFDREKGDHDRTVLIVDPPRKGCDEGFLRQVVRFRPRVMVYVSCNVHTMADNVGMLIRLAAEALTAEGKDPEVDNYKIQSVRAIDLFPQTHHAEGLLVLRRN